MNNFGEFLSQKRKEANLTQKQLSSMLYVSESTISKWEKNKANPDISMVCELAKILNVSEHELLTACVDKEERKKNVYAKRWKKLTLTWNLFFLISYSIALLTCFIVNLAVNKTLSWFFIVLFSIILSASFTTIPKYVTKYKLLLVPLTQLVSLLILLLVCEIYTNGNWFFLATVPILVGFIIVFAPFFMKKYLKIFKHLAIVSVGVDMVLILAMQLVIQIETGGEWFFSFALPLTLFVFTMPFIMTLIIRYTHFAKLIKSSVITFLYIPYLLVGYIITRSLCESAFNIEVNKITFPNFLYWNTDIMISSNVCAFIVLSLLFASFVQMLIWSISRKKKR